MVSEPVSAEARRVRRLVVGLCAGEVAGLLPVFAFPALQGQLATEWALSSTALGWLNGVFYLGYALSVPVLGTITDQVDARRVHLGGGALLALATLALGAAPELGAAITFRALAGIGLAGFFIPGLKALVDRHPLAGRERSLALYTATFGIGTSLAFYLGGVADAHLAWRSAFLLATAGPVAAVVLGAWALDPRPPRPRGAAPVRFSLRGNPVGLAYVLAYAGHMWELFAFRAWIVPFLTAARGAAGPLAAGLAPATAAALATLIGTGGNLIGAESATRVGRRRVVVALMTASAAVGVALGLLGGIRYPWVVALTLVYGCLLQADSAALYAGTVASFPEERRGAALAFHSTLGFLAAAASPLAVGWVLDHAGGVGSLGAWPWALAVIAAGSGVGPLILAAASRKEGSS